MWYKNNKAAEKWTEQEAEDAFYKTFEYVENDSTVILKTEVDLFLLKGFGISSATRLNWVNKQYVNNRCIQSLWEAIGLIVENRVIKDGEVLRPNIQALVIQTKHNYRERKESQENVIYTEMPSIEIDGEEVAFDIEE